MGNGGSKKFYNKAKPHDPRNGTFCTVPTKLTFRTKDERIKAEQTLRKFGMVKCSVPYPKKLRTIIGDIVKKGKQVKPNNYIRVKVDTESLTVSAHASVQSPSGRWVWEDLELTTEIPLDVLDKGEQVTLDTDAEAETIMDTETVLEQQTLYSAAVPAIPVQQPQPQPLDRLVSNYNSYPNLSYAVQNCNSLNISTVCNKQLTKIIAITALCTDIIFLSDLRLNSNEENVEKVKKLLLYNSTHSYDPYFHSTKNKRGVGILISKRLSYTIEKTYKDEDENILGLIINIDGYHLRIFSIYGPNFDNKDFYNRIDYFLSQDSQVAAVLGGDWNSSYSTSPTADNIDIRNMRNPPSLVRSGWLREICNNHNLSDPFRALHPNLKDYTFSPPGARINRSRLDFFLIYDELIPMVRTCSILETQQIKLLDHKPVLLNFKKDKYASKPFINKTIMSLPRTDNVVLASVLDTYLLHVDAEDADNIRIATPPGVHHADGHNPIRAEQTKVGNLLSLIREYNTIYEQSINDPQNRIISLELAAKDTEISILKNSLLSFELIEQLKIIPPADIFLETLMSTVKGNVISFQQWVKKTENSRKAKIVNKIREIRLNPDPDFDRIGTLENELLDITDKEIREKVKSMKIFECLNAEKPTPLFISLARCRSSSKKLSALKKSDGTAYAGDAERNEGIVQYYENLYKKPPGERIDYTNCIEDFLGPTVLNHAIVQNSKLTENEKMQLDLPLSIEELDLSISKANMNSAPGIDGLSNKFLKKYWVFFRTALFRYCNCCFENSELTANFLSASIKLIPKKGDATDLKNWRPISLLSNMYKIISRAINNRLNKVVNRICSRSQKGFNDSRYTQECLINVIETINHCNRNGISGAVVAVDMAKAFDTLSHGYLEQVFSFFNMGPYIRKWLSLLGTKQTACIILNDNSYSRNFQLGRGSAQGDNISPNTFNFGDQILIFKIELDPNIAGIWRNFQIPPLVPPLGTKP